MAGKHEVIGPDHPISRLAYRFAEESWIKAAENDLSRLQVCIAMANAIGMIFHEGTSPANPPPGIELIGEDAKKCMSRDQARERVNDLHMVIRQTFEMAGGVEGSA